MTRVDLPFTYGYENFIDEEEKKNLSNWILFLHNNQKLNLNVYNRYFGIVDNVKIKPIKSFINVKNRVLEIENLTTSDFDPFYKDFVSINLVGGEIDSHIDENLTGRIHTRYNLLLSLPEDGGLPLYNNCIIKVKEKMLWRCQAGRYFHGSTPVKSNKPRLNISFGFQIINDN